MPSNFCQGCNFQILFLYLSHLQIITLSYFYKTFQLFFPPQYAKLSTSIMTIIYKNVLHDFAFSIAVAVDNGELMLTNSL
jgi:hypothetical protein